MLLIWSDSISLSYSMRVYELDRYKVAVRHWSSICNSEWIFEDGLDGTPDVDNLRAALEELIGFFGKVIAYAVESSLIGLVNVNALDRTSQSCRILWWAPDCMVENKDFRRSSTVRFNSGLVSIRRKIIIITIKIKNNQLFRKSGWGPIKSFF